MTETPGDSEGFAAQSTLSRLIAMLVIGCALVETRYSIGFGQSLLALTGIISLLCLNNGDGRSLGLTLVPIRGWKFWFRITIFFAFLICVAAAFCALVWLVRGWEFPKPTVAEPSFATFVFMCIHAPVSEEILFRVLLTAAFLPTLGERRTIVAGGVTFALLHVLYGNPGPDNQVAGFLLCWAYLKSKTILVPLFMHSAGNLIALGSHIAAWYFY